MLSKTEKEFLEGNIDDRDYSYVLEHRIRSKLHTLTMDLLLLLNNSKTEPHLTEIRKILTENRKTENTLSVNALNAEGSQRVNWRRGWELNPCISALQADA